MKEIVAFDLDGTLALSKQPLTDEMAELLAGLLEVAQVAVISGGDWPQFEKQVASRMPAHADLSRLWMMPTSGAKLFVHRDGTWTPVYAELFTDAQKAEILEAFDAALEATGFVPEQTWGERIEDRGSQITFSALGQQAPLEAKEVWDPDFAKRKVIQADLVKRLPGVSVNLGGATSVDITQPGVDKAWGLKRLAEHSGVAEDKMLFIGDAIFPGGNDYPAKAMGLDTVCVRDPADTINVVTAIIACQKSA
ncbi:HAD-IIB family hydrolase [Novosphingobium mangrovi (ex Hu et al. 2023)]|uniref:phosphomannomutase n=1 Tax=Novosphingobium mangrovi (ex Hu et al. 2023) TaxID=2930094 RepID=A0ABT0AC86_9SPHN|nr:HAD-IIB family hydrolase [Novosphingobium mangrovi (ex Hu et al. 2023)]MCJ1960800.1 HAD-IIB family hydrolase [Novosphingobium mangrovi (ex Hu et al. 2023)]